MPTNSPSVWQPVAERVNTDVCEPLALWPQQSQGQEQQATHKTKSRMRRTLHNRTKWAYVQSGGQVKGLKSDPGWGSCSSWRAEMAVFCLLWWGCLSCWEIKSRCRTGTHIMQSIGMRKAFQQHQSQSHNIGKQDEVEKTQRANVQPSSTQINDGQSTTAVKSA